MTNLHVSIYSFDVFDTVLTRVTAEPTGIFGLIQQKMVEGTYELELPHNIIQNYAEIRINAEAEARKITHLEEVTIYLIYDIVRKEYNLTEKAIKELIEIEIKEEIDSIYGVPKIINRIKNLRDSGSRIIFISDTYLPTSSVLDMLLKVGAYENVDHFYNSSEVGLTKTSGNLFKYVLEQERCEYTELLHIGDNLNSDIKSGSKIGINVEYFPDTKLNRYEQVLLGDDEKRYCDLQGQLTAGISRLTRLSKNYPENDTRNTLFDIGANVAGPILVPYVKWTLKNAVNVGLEKLYFISRDGQILFEIAKLINTVDNLELRYLYGSRQAWHIASTFNITNKELEWILLRADVDLTIAVVASRLGINCDEFMMKLNEISERNWSANSILNSSETELLKKLLLQNPLEDLILNEAKKRRELMVNYLIQEKFIETPASGIVDLGWHGNIQKSLKQVVDSFSKGHNILGFYFGLVKRSCPECSMEGFFFDPKYSNKSEYPKNSPFSFRYFSFMELFASADHGLTMKYEKKEDSCIVPVLKEQIDTKVIAWGLPSLRDGIFTYTNLYKQNAAGTKFDFDKYRERFSKCMNLLVHTPTPKEADVIGSYLFASDQSESRVVQFAPKFDVTNYIKMKIKGKHFETYWLEGTFVRSDKLSSIVFAFVTLSSIVFAFVTRQFGILLKKANKWRS
ncbi:HAD family hydrolase [Methanosarcina vacuolata]|uniref:Hydrolase (HAD superfamily) n=1 Tax=Methanosarcina vacuolata Z-761 TaxID=1434123 RepID=A0A0E3Q8B9_9EURY|nr:HAD-IA family hydrolase [Methanosarcina vacuolata]AKB45103.1 hypothetical protein MSVAZ_2834 [Methanosarcina vacuolata Z-761]